MRSDMKLSLRLPLIFTVIVIVIVFIVREFDVIDVISIIGLTLIIGYYSLGYIHKKDALVIENDTMRVRTPFKAYVFTISDIQQIYVSGGEYGVLRGLYQQEDVILCGNIYFNSLREIKTYLLEHYSHITEGEERHGGKEII